MAGRQNAAERHSDRSSEVVTTLATLGKAQLPAQIARWLDALDETGRWALLKLVTGALRIGVSARLAKTAAAALGDKDVTEIELMWPGLAPPYVELFAWLEGRAEKPVDAATRRRSARRCWRTRSRKPSFDKLDPADFIAEWKWDGIRVQAVAGSDEHGERVARLYSRTGEDISKSFPDLLEALRLHGAIDGELLIMREGRVQTLQRAAAAAQPQSRHAEAASPNFPRICAPTIFWSTATRTCANCRSPSGARGSKPSSRGSTIRASIISPLVAVRHLGRS